MKTAKASALVITTADIRLSPHFSASELRCPCCGVMVMDTQVVEALEALRSLLGAPIRVTSGYRCPRHNKEIGGHPTSLHMAGEAVDIQVPGWENKDVAEMAAVAGFRGIIVYETHVHLDMRSDMMYMEKRSGRNE